MYDSRLDLFLQVTEVGSFTKAAKSAFLTPAAVMKQMNTLENDIGVSLFDRTPRGITLTPAGKVFKKEALNIIRYSDDAIQRTRQAAQQERYTIRVGSSLLQPHQHLLQLWSVIRQYTTHQFELDVVPFDDVGMNFRNTLMHLGEDVDVIFAAVDVEYLQDICQFFPIEREPFCFAVPLDNPLSRKPLLTYDDLRGQSVMMVPSESSANVARIRRELTENHPSIRIVDASNSYDMSTFNHCVQNDLVLLTFRKWEDIHPFMKTIPMDWDFAAPSGLLYPLKMNEGILRFIETFAKAQRKGAFAPVKSGNSTA